jgi:uncharacterized RDD family membrane protein YckC
MTPVSDQPRPRLWRRLAAAGYDGLIVVALWFLGTALLQFFTRGEAVYTRNHEYELLYQFYLLAIAFAFFGGFWTRDGRTLGMLAWRLKVVRSGSNGKITWLRALLRYLSALLSWALLGAGFWWSLLDTDGMTWHDRLSGTELQMTGASTGSSGQSPH